MQKTDARIPVAIIGSGNIGTDLMIKVMRNSRHLSMAAMVGIDPQSDGLARAARLGAATTAQGIDGLVALPCFKDIGIGVLGATDRDVAAAPGAVPDRVVTLPPTALPASPLTLRAAAKARSRSPLTPPPTCGMISLLPSPT